MQPEQREKKNLWIQTFFTWNSSVTTLYIIYLEGPLIGEIIYIKNGSQQGENLCQKVFWLITKLRFEHKLSLRIEYTVKSSTATKIHKYILKQLIALTACSDPLFKFQTSFAIHLQWDLREKKTYFVLYFFTVLVNINTTKHPSQGGL